MKQLPVIIALLFLAFGGLDTATAAAIGAAVKNQETEQARNIKENAAQKIQQAGHDRQRRADQSDDAAK